ncbi:MAG TPA: TlpA disulfide reductase family protein [Patescibacteria group bacterium]|nr:TlpA disulfide reductase family protein [Patescibacteria group bacterium]
MSKIAKSLILILIFLALNVYVYYAISLDLDIFDIETLEQAVRENILKQKALKSLPADIILVDYDGHEVKIRDYLGQPLVINFWSSWCPFCLSELESLEEAQREFAGQVVIMAVNRGETLDKAKDFPDLLKLKNLTLFLDKDDYFYGAIDGQAMPETLFVDKDGLIVHRKRGPILKEEIRQSIKLIK